MGRTPSTVNRFGVTARIGRDTTWSPTRRFCWRRRHRSESAAHLYIVAPEPEQDDRDASPRHLRGRRAHVREGLRILIERWRRQKNRIAHQQRDRRGADAAPQRDDRNQTGDWIAANAAHSSACILLEMIEPHGAA